MNEAIIAAIAAAIIAILTAVGNLIVTLRTKKQLTVIEQGQKEIHILVNSRLTTALKEISILKEQLSIQRS